MADLSDIQTFVIKFFDFILQKDNDVQKTVREWLYVDVKGFREFIRANGRVYRYGMVSSDTPRTCTLLRGMFEDDFSTFKDVVGGGGNWTSWDDVDASNLKVHLQNQSHDVFDALTSRLPAPLHVVDATTREWLRCVYGNVMRFNAECGTNFTSWDEVDTLPPPSSVKETTLRDIADVKHMLQRATQVAMKDDVKTTEWMCPVFEDVVHVYLPTLMTSFPHHGFVELVMATLGAVTQMHDAFFLLLLLYIAHNFVALPEHAHVYSSEETAASRDAFFEYYYTATMSRDLDDDWKLMVGKNVARRPVTDHIPASTLYEFSQFQELVNQVCHILPVELVQKYHAVFCD
jgi:hypothetical protein